MLKNMSQFTKVNYRPYVFTMPYIQYNTSRVTGYASLRRSVPRTIKQELKRTM